MRAFDEDKYLITFYLVGSWYGTVARMWNITHFLKSCSAKHITIIGCFFHIRTPALSDPSNAEKGFMAKLVNAVRVMEALPLMQIELMRYVS